jgi:hypothetical protein
MPVWGWILIGIAVVLIIAAVIVLVTQQRRSSRLRQRFGAEYDRTVGDAGQRRAGEAALRHREEQRAGLDIRPLTPAARTRYSEQWLSIQERFVDQPDLAVTEADTLLTVVMNERGYPVDDFEAQAALISVDHPDLVQNYRVAHRVMRQNRERRATTEELREALLRYRSLFEELLRPDSAGDTTDDAVTSGDRTRADHAIHPRRSEP